MKKEYSKPGIIIEDFNLIQNVSLGSCGITHETQFGSPTHWSNKTCGWDDGLDIFWVSAPACTKATPEDAVVNGVCYNNPAGGMNIFGSY